MAIALKENSVIKFNSKPAYKPLPEGDYRFTVIEHNFEMYDGNTDTGGKTPKCCKYTFTLRIEHDNDTTDLTWPYYHVDTQSWKIANLCLALGVVKEGMECEIPWARLDGKSGLCHINIRKYTRNGEERETNDVTGFIVPEEKQPHETEEVSPDDLPF